MNKIEIPKSKTKMFLMLSGSVIFVAAGMLFMINPEKYVSFLFRSPTLIFVGGLVSVLFFSFVAFTAIKKMLKTEIGIKINEEGIFDNSGGASAGLIYWKDIKTIDMFEVVGQKIIRIVLKNPNEYIERQTSSMKKKLMTANYKQYGSPVQISANTLKITFSELYKLIQNRFSEYNDGIVK